MLVGAFGQVDLGARDMQEAVGVAVREGAGFGRADDVVRRRGHPRRVARVRAQGSKGANGGHVVQLRFVVRDSKPIDPRPIGMLAAPMSSEEEQLRAGIAALERQRALLGDAVVDASLAGLRSRLPR